MKIIWIDTNTIKLLVGGKEIFITGNYGEGCGIAMEFPGYPDIEVNSQDNDYKGFGIIELKENIT